MAQSEPAAAPEEAKRRRCRLRRADRRGEAAALGPEGLGSSSGSSSSGSTSPPRRRRAEAEAAAAGERVRERASLVGEGRRPRLEAKARGERPRPPRARALAAASSRSPSLACLPSPSPRSCRARAFTPLLLPHGNGARRRLRSGSRALSARRGERAARLLASPTRAAEEALGPRQLPFPTFSRRGGAAAGPAPGSVPRASPASGFLSLLGPEARPGASQTPGRRAAPSPIPRGRK